MSNHARRDDTTLRPPEGVMARSTIHQCYESKEGML